MTAPHQARTKPRLTRRCYLVFLGAAATALTACGSASTAHPGSSQPSSSQPSSRQPSSSQPTTVSVQAGGLAFTGVPSQLPAGVVTWRVRNADPHGLHEATILRLAGRHTAGEIKARIAVDPHAPTPAWVSVAGGLTEIDAGVTASWTGVMAPGSYVLADFTTDARGRSLAALGMLNGFTVTGTAPAITAPPATGATATIGPHMFAVPTLASGATSITVRNTDRIQRSFDLSVIRPGKTLADVMAETRTSQGPPAAIQTLAGTDIPPGTTVVLGFQALQKGRTYIFLDPDHLAQGAATHFVAP